MVIVVLLPVPQALIFPMGEPAWPLIPSTAIPAKLPPLDHVAVIMSEEVVLVATIVAC